MNRQTSFQSLGEQLAYGGNSFNNMNNNDNFLINQDSQYGSRNNSFAYPSQQDNGMQFLNNIANQLLSSPFDQEKQQQQKLREQIYEDRQKQIQQKKQQQLQNNSFMKNNSKYGNQDDSDDDIFEQSNFDFGANKSQQNKRNQKNNDLKQQLKQQNKMMSDMMKQMKENKDHMSQQEQKFEQLKQKQKEDELLNEIKNLKKEMDTIQQNPKKFKNIPDPQDPDDLYDLLKEAIQEKQLEDGINRLQNNQPFNPPPPQYYPPPPQYYPPPPQYYPPPERQKTKSLARSRKSTKKPTTMHSSTKKKTTVRNDPTIIVHPSVHSLTKPPSIVSSKKISRVTTPQNELTVSKSITQQNSQGENTVVEEESEPVFSSPPMSEEENEESVVSDPKSVTKSNLSVSKKPLSSQKSVKSKREPNPEVLRKFRIIFQAICFEIFLYNMNRKRELKRRKIELSQYAQKYQDCSADIMQWLANSISASMKLLKIYKKTNIDVTNNRGNVSDKEFNDRTLIIQSITESFNQGLLKYIQDIPKEAVQFFCSYFGERMYLPDGSIFAFNLIRLEYNPTLGYLENVTPQQKEMLIGFIIFINFYIGNLLVSPEKFLKKVFVDSPNSRQALKIVSSLVYHALLDLYRKECPVIETSWVAVTKEVQTQPMLNKFPLKFEAKQVVADDDHDTTEEVCVGQYTKEDLKDYLDQNQGWMDQVKIQLEEFLTKISDIMAPVDKEHLEGISKQKREQALKYINELPQGARKSVQHLLSKKSLKSNIDLTNS